MSVSLWSHPLYETSCPLYLCHHSNSIDDITATICMISYPIYMISPILLSWKHEYIWHLTHHIWHHIHCISVVTPPLSMPSQQLWKSSHLAHVWHHTLHHIHTYDINSQYLWHHKPCILNIRSPIYDITSMVYNISSPITVASQPLYL